MRSTNEPAPTGTPSLRLRHDAVRGAMAAQGITSNEDLARLLGLGLSTVKRVMSAQQQPSAPFIAAIRLRLGLPFDLIVEAVPTRVGLAEPIPA